MRNTALFALSVLLFASQARAALKTEPVQYRHGDVVLEGTLAYDDAAKDARPGVLVVHEWWGLNDYARKRAEQLAELGYVAFALDMYGKGVAATDYKEAGRLSGLYKSDRKLMRERAKAGLDVLRKNARVDAQKIAAIGYCFGGTCVLELARGGADLKGVASFHGGLNTPAPDDAKNIRGKVLVLHGADDPYVPAAEVSAFEDEMRKSGVDWQLISYGGAVHAFTNSKSGSDPSKGVAYNEKADRRSWDALQTFFAEIFK